MRLRVDAMPAASGRLAPLPPRSLNRDWGKRQGGFWPLIQIAGRNRYYEGAGPIRPTVIHYNKLDNAGHFAVWEQPQLLCEENRAGDGVAHSCGRDGLKRTAVFADLR